MRNRNATIRPTVEEILSTLFDLSLMGRGESISFSLKDNTDIEKYVYFSINKKNEVIVNYNKEKLAKILEKVLKDKKMGEYIEDNKYYEVLLNKENKESGFIYGEEAWMQDKKYNLSFTHTKISEKYGWYIVFSFFKYASFNLENLSNSFFFQRMQSKIYRIQYAKNRKELEFNISEANKLKTNRQSLKIKSESIISEEKMIAYKNTHIYSHLYNDHNLRDISDLSVLFNEHPIKFYLEKSDDRFLLNREYEVESLKLYRKAFEAENIFVLYILYYQILEYHFDRAFEDYLLLEMENKLALSSINIHDNQVKKILEIIVNDIKKAKKINEEENLKILLKTVFKSSEEINILKERINLLSGDGSKYYKENNIDFSGSPTINWNDSIGVYSNMAKRIYRVRNSLVHNKEDNANNYRHDENEEELIKEIPLIRSIAEAVILYSSELLKI